MMQRHAAAGSCGVTLSIEHLHAAACTRQRPSCIASCSAEMQIFLQRAALQRNRQRRGSDDAELSLVCIVQSVRHTFLQRCADPTPRSPSP